jgi:protein TonB
MVPRQADRLAWALVASLALHGLALWIPLAAPRLSERAVRADTLEVILLNTRRSEKSGAPKKPQALAQSHSAGGGDAERGRITAPDMQRAQGNVNAEKIMSEQLAQLQQQQAALLSQLQQQSAPAGAPAQRALAEIERRIQQENARPRTRYLGPSTREVAYAEYYDRLRRKIEAQGTRHFPTHLGQRLYGAPTLILTIDAQGKMVATEVAQSSGQPELDRRARAIASSSAPFGEFSPDMRRQADQLAWVVRFTFSAESGLQTQWVEPATPKGPKR